MATVDSLIPEHVPLSKAPRDLSAITAQERANPLPYWDGTVAFQLGCALRTRLLTFEKPVVIDISTISEPGHVLFRAVTGKGTSLDNDYWVSRKRRAVVRWGCSSWFLGNKFGGDEEAFKAKLGLGERASEYAIHGGGVPIFVKGCDTMVAVVVVSGLKQWDDHQVIIEELEGLCKSLQEGKN
ncbi:hypothetical protein DE146DRAFT_476420 [Phaeosphaeria sp. MPI-PUGE-AT-0046c]|nr:hypothetical protein DE146DRAFT_476420 [Phaeosphaeria sp. MPI-PUGE-AT-0046c]